MDKLRHADKTKVADLLDNFIDQLGCDGINKDNGSD